MMITAVTVYFLDSKLNNQEIKPEAKEYESERKSSKERGDDFASFPSCGWTAFLLDFFDDLLLVFLSGLSSLIEMFIKFLDTLPLFSSSRYAKYILRFSSLVRQMAMISSLM